MSVKLRPFFLLLPMLSALSSFAQAPVISYTSPHTFTVGKKITPLSPSNTGGAIPAISTVTVASVGSPDGVAVDAAGNLYVGTDFVAQRFSSGSIVKISTAGLVTTIDTGFLSPKGVAVDASGNIFVADYQNTIKKIHENTGKIGTFESSFNRATSIGLDSAGNIYVADEANVKKIAPTGGQPTIIPSAALPSGLASDGSGNLYVSSLEERTLAEITPAPLDIRVLAGTPGGSSHVAVDANGNVYFLTSQANVARVGPGGILTMIGTGISSPAGIAIDAAGNIYVTDVASQSVKKIKSGAYSYTISPALPSDLNFDSATGIISGTPTYARAAVNYTITGSNASGSSSAVVSIKVVNAIPPPHISYAGPQVYNTNTAISPLGPANSGGAVATGTTQLTVANLDGQVNDLAVDVSGNIYVTKVNEKTVIKIPADGSPSVVFASGFAARGVALDAAGNVYLADQSNNCIKKIPAAGGTPVIIASGFNPSPIGVALDAANNIYVIQTDNADVTELPAAAGPPVYLGNSALNFPQYLAVDNVGNIYVTNSGTGTLKIAAGSTGAINLPGGGGGSGVAADNAGGVYLTADFNAVDSISSEGGNPKQIGSGFNTPAALAINAFGNLFVADSYNYVVKEEIFGGYKIWPALPAGLIFNNSTGVISGTPTVYSPSTVYTIAASNVAGGSLATLNIQTIGHSDNLLNLIISHGTLTPAFAPGITSYTASVSNNTTSITVKAAAPNDGSTIKINGTTVPSRTPSASIPLSVGPNTINAVIIAPDGTPKTYTIVITRAPSANANLSNLKINHGALTPAFATDATTYTASVSNGTTSITVKPVTADATATVKVNGTTVASGTASASIPLTVGANTLTTIVTAEDGTTTKTYTVTVTRAASANAGLSYLGVSHCVLSPAFTSTGYNYSASVGDSIHGVVIRPKTSDTTAAVTVNGTMVASGSPSPIIPLAVGPNTITTEVTAQDGTTTKTYTLTITRAASGLNAIYDAIGVTNPADRPQLMGEDINVHQGVSPNGDGVNDFLIIENITNYPDNKLQIMNRNGQLIYVTQGYDNSSKVFDGHSNKNGQMQLPGTYFYQLDYTVSGISKHKTGFIVLKY
jgi:gliding motility-associated-like protein